MKNFLAPACFLAILAFFGLSPAAAQSIPGPALGSAAPSFNVTTLDGRTVSLASYKGKVLVLNFWATWCPPCRQETPDMIAAYRKLHGPNVEFLGLDATEQAPIIRAFVAAKNLPYAVAIDTEKKATAAYDVRGIPTTFVIDANGIVRARYVDIIPPAQLVSFVNDAKAGRNGAVNSAIAQKIDATLDPKQFSFSGGHDSVLRSAKSATDAINASNKLLGQADPAKGQVVDYLHVRAQQADVLAAMASGLAKVASSNDDKKLLARTQGDLATDREQWSDAVSAYQRALAIDPKDQDSLGGLAFAYYEQHDWKNEIDAYSRLAALNPDPDTYVSIGKAYQQLKDYSSAAAAEKKAVDLALANYAKQKTTDTTIYAAYTWLYLARGYVEAGDIPNAHNAFAQTMRYAQQLKRGTGEYQKYTEEAQEGMISLSLPNGKTAVSMAPWTGPDLPGSVKSTLKYRLVVAGKPDSVVHLRATDLAKGWIASFCSDKVCAPMQLVLTMPASGVKIIEFQLIPNEANAPKHTNASVHATGGSGNASTSVAASL